MAVWAIAVSTFAVIVGVWLLWDILNPLKWHSGAWAAIGTWVAGVATFLAVGVALIDSRRTRRRARREIAAAETRANQSIWTARREREVGVLVAFRQPVRAVCYRLDALEDRIKGFNDMDGFYTRDPLPAISDDAARLLGELDRFIVDDLLPAYGFVDEAWLVVKDSSMRSLVEEVHDELNRLEDMISDWRQAVGAQGAPVLPDSGVGLSSVLDLLLVDARDAVDKAYPVLLPNQDLGSTSLSENE